MASTAATIALNYGYNWITGTPLGSNTLLNTGNSNLDYTRIGFWALGEGEMDGLEEMWDTVLDRLYWQSEFDNPAAFHFHRGCDAVIGSGTYPASSGPDQGIDSFWTNLQPGLTPINYNRIAYYSIQLKQLINNPPNTNQNDPSVWADLNPIGLWRGIRTRTFDATGAMTGYSFSTNPADHFVDLLCRRRFFVEYNIDITNGADDLPKAVKNRFDWGAIADAKAYFDEPLANNEPRFHGSYSFSASTTLQGCVTQILTCCRSYQRERAGMISLVPDSPRASVFTFSRKNSDASTFSVTDSSLHTAPNVYVPTFRDLLVPAAATIVSISAPDYTTPTVQTANPHPFANGDYLIIGGTNSRYDGYWQVNTVPDVDEAYSFTMNSKGSNYPQEIGGGGLVGLRYSRFKSRAPEFNHHASQYAKGAVGVGIPAQRNKIRVQTDFANATLDQVQRISYYQMGRALGPDTALGIAPGQQRPAYNAPVQASLECPQWMLDAAGSGARAIQLEPGDVVTLDDTVSPSYTGLYQILKCDAQLAGSTAGSGIDRTPAGGKLTFQLEPYSDANYPDVSDPTQAGWFDVPGSGPGRDADYTSIPLADGGELAIFSGSGASGDTVALPTGFNPANSTGWASPQGYVGGEAHLHFIQDCEYNPNRQLILIYNDSAGNTWGGDLNYLGIAWNATTSAVVTTLPQRAGDMQPWIFYEFTILGGEKICFGIGLQQAAQQVPMPTGYSAAKAIQIAFPHGASDSGQPAFGFGSYVGSDQVAHHFYQDQGAGMTWEGSVYPFFFGFQNNMGTWVQESNGWWHAPLTNGMVLAVAGYSILDAAENGIAPANYPATNLLRINTGVLPLPTGLTQTTLQAMTGANSFEIDADHPAHGQRQCYIDANLNSLCSFQDGSSNIWHGAAGVFALICDVPTGPLAGAGTPTGPAPTPLTFTTPAALPAAYIGEAFTQQLVVVGGSGSGYAFTLIAGGTPPSGVTVSATGLISFEPSATGAFAFSVSVTDSAKHAATLACTVAVSAAAPTITPVTPPEGQTGVPYSLQLAVTGGNGGSVAWRISAGSLPSYSGLALSAIGVLYGSPTQTGVYTFTVTANVGGTDSAPLPLALTVTGAGGGGTTAQDGSRPIDTSF